MSKEDKIWVYTIGCVSNYRGITGFTHDLLSAMSLLEDHCRNWDDWKDVEEFRIERGQEQVADYLYSNQFNISVGEAEELAKEHGFTLEDIGYTKETYGLY